MKKAFFIIYLIFLLLFVVLKFDGSFNPLQETIRTIEWNREMGITNANIVPFRTIMAQIKHANSIWALKNLIANIVLFMPWGFLLPLMHERLKKIIPFTCLSLGFILLIEMAQFVFLIGHFDVDDIILNLVGAFWGYIIVCMLSSKKSVNV